MVKYPLANSRETGDMGLIPGSGRFPGGGNGNHSNFFFTLIFLPEEFHGQRKESGIL